MSPSSPPSSASALIRAFETSQGVPVYRRAGFLTAQAAIGYAAFALLLVVWAFPVAFGLTGTPLLLARLGVAVAGAALVAVVAVGIRRAVLRQVSVWMIALQRGWEYVGDPGFRVLGGSIEQQVPSEQRTLTEFVVADRAPVPFSTGIRTFTVGDRRAAAMTSCRVVRIGLDAPLPRYTLRSRAGSPAFAALPRRARAANVLRLEGNFSDVFELAVPAGYERDALYLFTPDLMAALIDYVGDLDLETVDDALLVYLPEGSLADPAVLARVELVVRVLGQRFGRRAARYRDDRVDPIEVGPYDRPAVAAAGRDTSTRVSAGAVLTAVLPTLVLVLLGVVLSTVLG